jgi:predicted negative regulator of RcsB-dependent stress response
MSNHLDLEEQEQIEQLKAFWGQYGNAITWGLTAIFAAFAAWNGFQYWQRQQAGQAAAMYDEVERMVASGDSTRSMRAFEEMKSRYPSTAYAQQAALLLAKASVQSGKPEDAKTALRWASEQGKDSALSAVARLRLASVLIESKEYDEAAKAVESDPVDAEYLSVFQDRRGDVYSAKGDKTAAIDSYKKAFASSASKPELQRLVRIKLNALGVDVEPVTAKAEVAGKAK